MPTVTPLSTSSEEASQNRVSQRVPPSPFWGVYLHASVFRAQCSATDVLCAVMHNGVAHLLFDQKTPSTGPSLSALHDEASRTQQLAGPAVPALAKQHIFTAALSLAAPHMVSFDYKVSPAAEIVDRIQTREGIGAQMRSSHVNSLEAVLPHSSHHPSAPRSYTLDAHARRRSNVSEECVRRWLESPSTKERTTHLAQAVQQTLYTSRLCSTQALFAYGVDERLVYTGSCPHLVVGGSGTNPLTSPILPGLEYALLSMRVGEEATFMIAPPMSFAHSVPQLKDLPRAAPPSVPSANLAPAPEDRSASSCDMKDLHDMPSSSHVQPEGSCSGPQLHVQSPTSTAPVPPPPPPPAATTQSSYSSSCSPSDESSLDRTGQPPASVRGVFSTTAPALLPDASNTGTSGSVSSMSSLAAQLIRYGSKRVLCIRIRLRQRVGMVSPMLWGSQLLQMYPLPSGGLPWPSHSSGGRPELIDANVHASCPSGGTAHVSAANPWRYLLRGMPTTYALRHRVQSAADLPAIPAALEALDSANARRAVQTAWMTAMIYALGSTLEDTSACTMRESTFSTAGAVQETNDIDPSDDPSPFCAHVHTFCAAVDLAAADLAAPPAENELRSFIRDVYGSTPRLNMEVTFEVRQVNYLTQRPTVATTRQYAAVELGSVAFPSWLDVSVRSVRPQTRHMIVIRGNNGSVGDDLGPVGTALVQIRREVRLELERLTAKEGGLLCKAHCSVPASAENPASGDSNEHTAADKTNDAAGVDNVTLPQEGALARRRSSTAVPPLDTSTSMGSSTGRLIPASDDLSPPLHALTIPFSYLKSGEQRVILDVAAIGPRVDDDDDDPTQRRRGDGGPNQSGVSAIESVFYGLHPTQSLDYVHQMLSDAVALLKFYEQTRRVLPAAPPLARRVGLEETSCGRAGATHSPSLHVSAGDVAAGAHAIPSATTHSLFPTTAVAQYFAVHDGQHFQRRAPASPGRLRQLLFATPTTVAAGPSSSLHSSTDQHAEVVEAVLPDPATDCAALLQAAAQKAWYGACPPQHPVAQEESIRRRILVKVIHRMYDALLLLTLGVPDCSAFLTSVNMLTPPNMAGPGGLADSSFGRTTDSAVALDSRPLPPGPPMSSTTAIAPPSQQASEQRRSRYLSECWHYIALAYGALGAGFSQHAQEAATAALYYIGRQGVVCAQLWSLRASLSASCHQLQQAGEDLHIATRLVEREESFLCMEQQKHQLADNPRGIHEVTERLRCLKVLHSILALQVSGLDELKAG